MRWYENQKCIPQEYWNPLKRSCEPCSQLCDPEKHLKVACLTYCPDLLYTPDIHQPSATTPTSEVPTTDSVRKLLGNLSTNTILCIFTIACVCMVTFSICLVYRCISRKKLTRRPIISRKNYLRRPIISHRKRTGELLRIYSTHDLFDSSNQLFESDVKHHKTGIVPESRPDNNASSTRKVSPTVHPFNNTIYRNLNDTFSDSDQDITYSSHQVLVASEFPPTLWQQDHDCHEDISVKSTVDGDSNFQNGSEFRLPSQSSLHVEHESCSSTFSKQDEINQEQNRREEDTTFTSDRLGSNELGSSQLSFRTHISTPNTSGTSSELLSLHSGGASAEIHEYRSVIGQQINDPLFAFLNNFGSTGSATEGHRSISSSGGVMQQMGIVPKSI